MANMRIYPKALLAPKGLIFKADPARKNRKQTMAETAPARNEKVKNLDKISFLNL